ncbi:TonB-dependent receptor [Paracidobacterium acidisoli]|uniref:TonB-dependent receptor n=1 Tax=Paracidobacterium acidisoli TaxID=2303751 RepID=A0A372IS02_9BACT|nr:carboxypeptidase regulatory-like domain-containing protein [Paracidobacterium acidisoli]MBT9330614.1 carboxypeptidase regulatory-like domain-containing protein [Paracidobacterium acidisoli]
MKRLLLFLLLASLPVMAQTDRGTITGTVTDPSGRRVVNADVLIRSNATGVETPVKTNNAGVYTATSLSTGDYDVSVEADGFASLRFEHVGLDVGQVRTLDAKLSVTGGSVQVNVRADSGLSKSSIEIGGVINGRQAQDLPLNGRSYVGLVSLAPGMIDSGTGTQQDVRAAGLSDEDNTWHLDGVDNSGINHQYQKVDLHLQVSTEAIAEFRANGVAYSADQGGSVGGQIEIVSKSGGDVYHGAAWEFIRNNVFDASPWNAQGTLPALRLNNFGANIGGPIVKKKLFFFANYEALRQNLNQTLSGTVPSTAYRAQVAAEQPVLAPLINAFPIGLVPVAGSVDQMTWYGSGPEVTHEDSGLVRADYHINDRMNAFVRFNTDHYTETAPDTFTPSTAFNDLNTPNATIGIQNTFTPTFLNDARYGFDRAEFAQGQDTPFLFALQIAPFTGIDTPSGSVRNDNSFTGIDDATLLRGRHTIKMGITVRRVQENKASPNTPDETISYQGPEQKGTPDDFLKNLIDSDSYAGAVPVTGQRLTEYFGYVLDQFKLGSTLNLNVGLRYENFGVDHEVLGRGLNVDPINCPNVVCPSNIPWYYQSNLEFSPRVGVIWSPAIFNGKTVFRSGFGIYDGFGQFGGLGQPIGNLATKYTLTQAQAPGFGYPVPSGLGVATHSNSPAGASIHRKITSVNEWTLSVQQEVARQTIAQVAYFGTRATHVFSSITLNGIINQATNARTYAGYSTIPYQNSSADAYTHALQASIQRNFSTGWMLSANYEWSHSIDDGGIGGGEADTPQNNNCLACERSSSDQDVRSYFRMSTIYQLPFGRGRAFLNNSSRITDLFLGGWQLSGIASARSGLPVNITMSRSATALPDEINKGQRPNRVPGVPLYPSHKTTQEWLNANALTTPASGTWGNLGRNAVRAPGIWQIDPALTKRFALTERVGLNFRAEAFNVLNRAQYGTPASTFGSGTYGLITKAYSTNATGTGTPRELQFSLKAEF